MKKMILLIVCIILSSNLFCETFYFGQVTDIHLGAESTLRENEKEISQRRIAALPISINKLNIPLEFVAFTGNTTNNGMKYDDPYVKYGVDAIKKIKTKLYFIPGNHDIYPGNYATRFNIESFIRYFGEISFVQEIKGVRFVFFYGENLRISTNIDGYNPLKWLETQLEESAGKPVILMTHSVPGEEYYDEKLRQIWDEKNAEKFKILLNNYNIKAIIAGHENADKMRYLGKIPVFIAPNFSVFDGRQASYRVYKYNDGEVTYFTMYIEQSN